MGLNSPRRILILAVGVVIIGALLVLRWYQRPDPDTGFTLTAAWQITQGATPYRDFFEYHAPGSFYLLAIVFAVFGSSYAVAKLFSLLLVLVGLYGLLTLGRLLALPSPVRLAVCFAWLTWQLQYPLMSYHAYAAIASIWFSVLLVAVWQNQSSRKWFALGLAAGGVVWLVQPRGAAAVFAGLGAAASRGWRPLGAYLLGGCVAGIPVIFLPWPEFWQSVVTHPMHSYLSANAVSLTGLLVAVAISLLFAVGALLARPVVGWWPLWWFTLLSLLTVAPRADLVYLSMVLWPLPVLVLALLRPNAHRPQPGRWLVGAGGVVLGITLLSTLTVHLGLWSILYQPSAEDPLALRPGWWDHLGMLVRERTALGESIFATPYLPWLYAVSQRPNATRYSYLATALHPSAFFTAAVTDLERQRTRIVVRQLESFAVSRGFHRDGGVLDVYLDAHYRVLFDWPERNIEILERQD